MHYPPRLFEPVPMGFRPCLFFAQQQQEDSAFCAAPTAWLSFVIVWWHHWAVLRVFEAPCNVSKPKQSKASQHKQMKERRYMSVIFANQAHKNTSPLGWLVPSLPPPALLSLACFCWSAPPYIAKGLLLYLPFYWCLSNVRHLVKKDSSQSRLFDGEKSAKPSLQATKAKGRRVWVSELQVWLKQKQHSGM